MDQKDNLLKLARGLHGKPKYVIKQCATYSSTIKAEDHIKAYNKMANKPLTDLMKKHGMSLDD